MFKVIIENTIANKIWSGEFQTLHDSEAWRDIQIVKPLRNIVELWYKEDQLTEEDQARALDTRLVEFEPETYRKEFLMPAEATVTIEDQTDKIDKFNKKEVRKARGHILAELSENILSIVSGHLYSANLDEAQADAFTQKFQGAYVNLTRNRPLTAKTYIDQITPDQDDNVTQDLLDYVNLEYEEYKEKYPSIIVF